MTEPREVRSYGDIDCAYDCVKDALHRLARDGDLPLFRVDSIHDEDSGVGLPPVTRVCLGWKDTPANLSAPVTSVEIYASALGPQKTRLEIDGHRVPCSRPPGGANGSDAADAYVRTLLDEIVEGVRRETMRMLTPNLRLRATSGLASGDDHAPSPVDSTCSMEHEGCTCRGEAMETQNPLMSYEEWTKRGAEVRRELEEKKNLLLAERNRLDVKLYKIEAAIAAIPPEPKPPATAVAEPSDEERDRLVAQQYDDDMTCGLE